MKTPAYLFSGALAVLVALAANAAEPDTPSCCRGTPPLPAANFTDKSIYQAESTWTTDGAKPIRLGALRGRPQVVAMFFTSCQFTCPVIVSDMKRLEVALPENLRTNVGFTLVSFDSERDTPAALQNFRARRELPETNWTLLRGEPEDVRELAALLGVNYRRDAGGQFAHSNLITVLNAEGEIVYQLAGLNMPVDDLAKKLAALLPK
jgi:protein SCO1/2